MALYTYLEKVFHADAVLHVGTHGAMEFMPGKQVGLSAECWPDRLIGELPNIYIYSVNNPSEGTIAKRRSYAELISYLTPPIENAGLYKDLASLKELLAATGRQPTAGSEQLSSIEETRERDLSAIPLVSGEVEITQRHKREGLHRERICALCVLLLCGEPPALTILPAIRIRRNNLRLLFPEE